MSATKTDLCCAELESGFIFTYAQVPELTFDKFMKKHSSSLYSKAYLSSVWMLLGPRSHCQVQVYMYINFHL